MTDNAITILIVDDDRQIRDQLDTLLSLEPDFEVIGLALGGEMSVHMAAALQPAIILMDVSMPDVDGFQATERIVAANNRVGIIMLSAHDANEYTPKARRAGACAYVNKPIVHDRLFEAIRHCYANNP